MRQSGRSRSVGRQNSDQCVLFVQSRVDFMSSKLFISYANQDKAVAKKLFDALSLYGYKVFWDTKVPTGKTFDTHVYENLTASDAVIVLWSKHSIASNYVKEEADYAKKVGKSCCKKTEQFYVSARGKIAYVNHSGCH